MARPFFTTEPDGDLVFPGPPWRLSGTPAVGSSRRAHAGASRRHRSRVPRRPGFPSRRRWPPSATVSLPFAGLNVVDLGTFWAGPYLAMYLGAFGADVVKVESIQRPDGFRFSGAFPQEGDDFYDRGPVWQGNEPRQARRHPRRRCATTARRLVRDLIAAADIVIENFSARVVEQFGLDYDAVRAIKPDVIMLRMPGFGLEGPWRDYVGWAMGIEQASGMAQVTGYPDRPMHPGGFADPMIAMHAGVALQAALEHRDRTGEGQMIEIAQLETACCLTADQPMDFELNGRIATRNGNRDVRMAPQGVYQCDDGDVGRAQHSPRQRLARAARRARPAVVGHRRVRHHCRPVAFPRRPRPVRCRVVRVVTRPTPFVGRLREFGLPVGKVLRAPDMYDDPQLNAREWYIPLENAKTGVRRYPGWPMRFSFAKASHRFGPPTLGQHNAEVLAELGVGPEELARLESEGIIGDQMAGR